MAAEDSPKHVAAIFGVTGLVGKELARRLTSKPEWKVYGIARNPDHVRPLVRSNFHFIKCDLQDPFEAQKLLSSLGDVTHMFWVTWASQSPYDTQMCCDMNKAMMANVLDTLLPIANSLKHVSLQTGLSHYVPSRGPFDDYDDDKRRVFDEESPRVSHEKANFYYVLEDLLKERLEVKRVAWSVHRPGLLLGSSCRTFYNVMGCLCVYGTICKYLDLPFVFGGERRRWEESFIDGSDSRLVAEQHIWAATNEDVFSADGQAFNAVNGSGFKWKEIWPTLGKKFGGARVPDDAFSEEFRYSEAMADKGRVWDEIVEKEGLVKTKMEDLANWEFLDVLFRCPVKLLATRDKADRLGFTLRYKTLDSILFWLEAMKNDKLIPK
ncbi:hypothetical protein TIFTF001_000245 [Ficus carica]|uniref:PRISE-like Rossmann-fold domain-containing protein n=1 Tax=Ficus carica TaxID=3494 RepID=A0AA87YUD4_FICCA|nr:hypothetical protein TIFTF001_000245 [Ficus carica]